MNRYPALFLGCLLLVTAAAALAPDLSYLFALVIFIPLVRKREWKRLLAAGVVALLFFLYVTTFYSRPSFEGRVEGVAHFEIESVRVVQSPFNRSWLYQGKLRTFKTESGETFRNLLCHLYLPLDKPRYEASCDYLIEGALIQKDAHHFVLKPKKNTIWKPVVNSHSFAEWRLQAKDWVRKWLKEEIPHPRVATFFIALSVGDLDERLLSMEFAKIGLQHILGISGFHFVLLAGFLGALLRLTLPSRWAYSVLLLLLSAYLFFVGDAPAALRGWVAITVFLLARIFHLQTTPFNALGVGLLVEILYNPLVITSIGFQLSFLCTWAILMLYPLLQKPLEFLMPKRSLQSVTQMHSVDQHSTLAISTLRNALALNLAVHLASLPLILFLFHKFPLQSLLYNLFFPFCFSISLLLLLIGILCSFLPPLSALVHSLNSAFTGTLLEMTSNPSTLLDWPVRVKTFPFALLIGLLALFFVGASHFHEKQAAD